MVVTLHNYRLFCLPSTFLRDGRICEDCLGGFPGAASCTAVTEIRYWGGCVGERSDLHRSLGTFDRVTLPGRKRVPSRQAHSGRHPEGSHRPQTQFRSSVPRRQGAGRLLSLPRTPLAQEGISTLLQAWRPTLPRLVVAGEGPERAQLNIGNGFVDHLGNLAADELPEVLAGARAVLLPSRWYEGAPRVILEAYAAGVPVSAAGSARCPH